MEIGDRFGYLTVVSIKGKSITCRCDCGNEVTVFASTLLHGIRKSCGCLGRGPKTDPLTPGTRFGKLTVISSNGGKNLCRCDCGNEKIVAKHLLLNGSVKSCGCLPRGQKPFPMLPGTRFGKFTVLSPEDGFNILCRCDCGTVKTVRRAYLINNKVKSCGCLPKGRYGGLHPKVRSPS